MRVLVTGGTGFVGSHIVAALRAAGHEVRLLVRSPERITPALAPHRGAGPVAHVRGDVTDPAAVRRAVAGCEAVVHAAAVYRLDSRLDRVTTATNATAARLVLQAAVEAGADPVVHVSTTAVLLHRHATVTPESPLTGVRSVYVRSKVESEEVARELQRRGAPVVIVYPGAVFGPHDPYLSDQNRRLRDLLRGLYPMWPAGGVHAVDVRDVARVHAAVLTPGAGPRRFLVPGHFLDGPTMFDTLRRVTGRRLPYLPVPTPVMRPLARVASAAQRVLPFHLPAEYEGVVILGHATRCDDTGTRRRLEITPRPLTETFTDTVRWLHAAGHLTARRAGAARA